MICFCLNNNKLLNIIKDIFKGIYLHQYIKTKREIETNEKCVKKYFYTLHLHLNYI